MQTQELYTTALNISDMFINLYLSDFGDADMFVRPDPSANHAAWQMGHLINSELNMIEAVRQGSGAKLPTGFAQRHSKDTAHSDNAADFFTKAEYMDFFSQQRAATKLLIGSMGEQDLNASGPEAMRSFAPTMGTLLYIAAVHPMLHAGQFVVIRRKLGKPILM